MYGALPEKTCTFFQFLSTVHAKVVNSNPTNYIFLRSTIDTLSTEHIKSPFFPKFKNWAGMPNCSTFSSTLVQYSIVSPYNLELFLRVGELAMWCPFISLVARKMLQTIDHYY